MSEVKFTLQEQADRLFPIYFYRKHLDIAAKDLLGLKLSPHHSMVLRDWGRNKTINIMFSSRGLGKSVLLAIFYVLAAILYPNLKLIAVAGQGFRGSKMVLMEVERIICGFLSGQEQLGYARKSLIDPQKVIKKDPAYWSIQFSNGSILYGIPLGATSDGATIRGLRCHFLGQDEAFLIPTKLYQAVLEPMMNVLFEPDKPANEQTIKNMTIAISTCDYTFRDFYMQFDYYKSVLEAPDKVATDASTAIDATHLTKDDLSIFEFNLDDAYYTYNGARVPTWGLDYERMIKKKNSPTTDINLWNAENKNIPLNLTGGYFPFEEIEKGQNVCLDIRTEQYAEALDSCSAPCILGIDTAPSGDNSAFVVIKAGPISTDRDTTKCMVADMGRKCIHLGVGKRCNVRKYAQVIYAFEENKMSQQDRIKLIYELMGRYNIQYIAIDARGGGLELSDLLADQQYIKHEIGEEAKAIYDPKRKPDLRTGLPILTLYSTSQETNMLFNGYLKGIICNQTLLFPKPLRDRPDNPRVLEIAGHVETLTNQVARIKATPAGKGVKFEIESIDPKTGRRVPGKKDLYSALLYAVGKMRDLLEEMQGEAEFNTDDLPLPVSFNM